MTTSTDSRPVHWHYREINRTTACVRDPDGRKPGGFRTTDWGTVTCPDCIAVRAHQLSPERVMSPASQVAN